MSWFMIYLSWDSTDREEGEEIKMLNEMSIVQATRGWQSIDSTSEMKNTNKDDRMMNMRPEERRMKIEWKSWLKNSESAHLISIVQ